MRHRRVYELLTSAGHSPADAEEIIADCRRGGDLARFWVATLFATRPRTRNQQFLEELHQRRIAATR